MPAASQQEYWACAFPTRCPFRKRGECSVSGLRRTECPDDRVLRRTECSDAQRVAMVSPNCVTGGVRSLEAAARAGPALIGLNGRGERRSAFTTCWGRVCSRDAGRRRSDGRVQSSKAYGRPDTPGQSAVGGQRALGGLAGERQAASSVRSPGSQGCRCRGSLEG